MSIEVRALVQIVCFITFQTVCYYSLQVLDNVTHHQHYLQYRSHPKYLNMIQITYGQCRETKYEDARYSSETNRNINEKLIVLVHVWMMTF